MPVVGTIAAEYIVELYNQAGVRVAIFDQLISLEYQKKVNDVGFYSFSIPATDDRINLFELDGKVVIKRRLPGLGINWYVEGVFLHRSWDFERSEDGHFIFTSNGVCLNDFLARTSVGYVAATIKAYKLCPAEQAMKEYVEENCGPTATVAYEREATSALPGFYVDTISGYGKEWEGDKSFENLLDTLQGIADFASIDFEVIEPSIASGVVNPVGIHWAFKTYENQMGLDRTSVGINPHTGKNAAGNFIVVVASSRGNVQTSKYTYDRKGEVNRVFVLGDGDGATRRVVVRETLAKDDSPWNRRETSRPQGGFMSQMEASGDEALEQGKALKVFQFTPLQQASCMYGLHFKLGDRITALEASETMHQRIMSVKVAFANGKENIALELK